MSLIFQCSDMEAAAHLLASRHDRTLITAVYSLTRPVRFRRSIIADLEPKIALGKMVDLQVERWQSGGGILINHRAAFKRPPHNAHLICEAPMTMAWLRKLMADTSGPVVVAHPPSWRGHRDEVSRICPPVFWCRKFHEAIEGAKLTAPQAAMLEALGIPSAGAVALTDLEACAAIGVTLRQLTGVRRSVLRGVYDKAYAAVLPLIPRVEPERPAALPFYRFIESLPSASGVRLAHGTALSEKVRDSKASLRALVHNGSVVNNGKIGFYWPEKIKPNYERIRIRHAMTAADVEEVIAYVDSLPRLSARALSRSNGAKPRPSRAPARHAAAAHARDTTD